MATKNPPHTTSSASSAQRHYPQTLAYLEAQGVVTAEPPRAAVGAGCVVGHPVKLRPGVVTGQAAQLIPQKLLEEVVDVAQVGGIGGEAPGFYLSFRQDELGPVRCEITLVKGRVVATFVAQDAHTCRLLAAESAVLRNLLEGRGLGPAEVIVRGP